MGMERKITNILKENMDKGNVATVFSLTFLG